MTQVHFTLNSDEIQKIITDFVQDDLAKDILITIFNQLMEGQRSEYIQAENYERSTARKVNATAITIVITRHVLGHLN